MADRTNRSGGSRRIRLRGTAIRSLVADGRCRSLDAFRLCPSIASYECQQLCPRGKLRVSDPSRDCAGHTPATPAVHGIDLLAALLRDVVAEPERRASALVDEFGSVGAVIAATDARVRRIVGAEAETKLRSVHAILRHVLYERIAPRPVIDNWKALLEYLALDLQHRTTEQVRVLHLDTKNGLLSDQIVSNGTIDHATIHIREVLARCLELGAAAVILVHNHPSGDLTPSRADIDLTRAFAQASRHLDIGLHDHLIISAKGHTSLRAKGLI